MVYWLIPVFFFAHVVLFVAPYTMAGKFFTNKSWFLKMGTKLVAAKEKQLTSSAILRAFTKAIEEDALNKARLIIFILVFFKSLGMLLIGIVGLSLLMVPLQAIMMAAIVQKTSDKGVSEKGLLSLTGIQLAAMTSAAVFGNFLGWRHFTDRMWFHDIFMDDLYLTVTASIVILLLCWCTALKEVDFYKANKRLIS